MALAGETVVFTGTLDMKRNEATQKAEAAGAKVTGSISGNTTLVVAGAAAGSKLDAAKAKGIAIITEAEFVARVSGGGGAAPKPASKKTVKKEEAEPAAAPPKKTAKTETVKAAPAAPAAAASKPAAGGNDKKRGKVVDKEVPGRGEYAVVDDWSIMLNQTNVGANNNKYYVIQVLQKGSDYFAWNRWGRVGEPGQNKMEKCGSLAGAISSFEKKFKDKTLNNYSAYKSGSFSKKDGKYNVVEMEDEEPGSGNDRSAPMGKLSKTQIEKGQAVLEEIRGALAAGKPHATFVDLSSKFFTLIPTDFGRRVPEPITKMEKLQEKEELLKFFLRMGFEEVEKDDSGLTPISGVMNLPVPATLQDAAGKLCAANHIRTSVEKGDKLAKQKSGNPVRLMTKDEYGSIMLYTSNAIYADLNKHLRSENRKAVEKYMPYLRLLFHAADGLPKKNATLWRGIGADLFPQYKVGSTITWWGVSSCTADKNVAKNFMQSCGGDCTFLTIETKTAVDISTITFFSNEKESILLPGTQLKVKSAKKEGKVAYIDLEEVGRAVS